MKWKEAKDDDELDDSDDEWRSKHDDGDQTEAGGLGPGWDLNSLTLRVVPFTRPRVDAVPPRPGPGSRTAVATRTRTARPGPRERGTGAEHTPCGNRVGVGGRVRRGPNPQYLVIGVSEWIRNP